MYKMRILVAVIELIICSVEDLKEQKVNIYVIAVGGLIGLIIGVTDMVFCQYYSYPLCIIRYIEKLVLSTFPGCSLLFISRLYTGIGEGDAFIIMSLGLLLGANFVVNILMISFILSGAYSVIICLTKKAKKDYSFPFVPFILAGYILCIIVQSFHASLYQI